MMLQHRSGIPNYTDAKKYCAAPKENDDEKLALILDLLADSEYGKDYAYSNTNYLLLSRIMDRVMDYHRFQFIQEEILSPLNLTCTFGSVSDVDLDSLMSDYYVGCDAD